MASSNNFELVAEAPAHDSDIQSVAVIPLNGDILSGGFDSFVKIWTLSTDTTNPFQLKKVLHEHQHWVCVVLPLDQGYFATGSQDKTVRVYDQQGDLVATGTGHSSAVTSLAWDSDSLQLVSGSWDGSARIWNVKISSLHAGNGLELECTGTLLGHENGCCVLTLPNNVIVTGSAGLQVDNRIDDSLLRIWSRGKVIKTMNNHQGPIRSLCSSAFDKSTFASCSNDGTVRIWSSTEFNELKVLSDPVGLPGIQPTFIYSIIWLDEVGELAAACDDGSVRIWDTENRTHKQDIIHPGSVWCITRLPNGDLLTGCSDGFLRIFSRKISRHAQLEVRERYAENTKRARAAAANQISNGGETVDPKSLCNIQDAPPGNADGDFKMFNRYGDAWVYQWSGDTGAWVEVGSVIGNAEGKEELDGKLYDKVFPVELESPSGGQRNLKLGFNNEDNPFVVARDFVNKNNLDDSNVDDIVNFINNVRKQSGLPIIDMSGSAPECGEHMDLVAEEYPDDRNVKVRNDIKRSFPFAAITGMYFGNVDMTKLFSKLVEFNGVPAVQNSPHALSSNELSMIEQSIQVLKEASRYHASSINITSVKALLNKGLKWDNDFVFPVLDLLRMMLIHPDGAQSVANFSRTELFERSLGLAACDSAGVATALCGSRTAANFFRHHVTASAALTLLSSEESESLVSKKLVVLSQFPNKNVRVAVATVILNCANALCHAGLVGQRHSDINDILSAGLLVAALRTAGQANQDSKQNETTRRCLLAIGCLTTLGKLSKSEKDAVEEFLDQVKFTHSELVSEINFTLGKNSSI